MNYPFNYPGFVQNALGAPKLVRLIWATNMTSQLLLIGGVILVHPILQIFQISKNFCCIPSCVCSVLRIHFFQIYWRLSSGLHLTRSRRYGHLCLHEFISSDLLLSVRGSRSFMIIIFSVRHRSHFL